MLFSPDKIDISMAMHLDQVKRKIPSTLLSWDAYSGTQEGTIIISVLVAVISIIISLILGTAFQTVIALLQYVLVFFCCVVM